MKDLTQLFDQLVLNLEKKKVPCRVKLMENSITIECGWNFPSSIDRKVFPIIEKLTGTCNSNIVDVCAESSGGTLIKSVRINGGPKRY